MNGFDVPKECPAGKERQMEKPDYDEVLWYVMRVAYQHELPVKEQLDAAGLESYVPVERIRRRNAEGNAIGWKTQALVHNYIFVHDSLNNIRRIKRDIPHLRYFLSTSGPGGLNACQTVPEKQMRDFMTCVRTRGSKLLDAGIDVSRGDRVRVLAGPFAGVEGIFVRMPNRHENRVVVRIEGVAAVATAVLLKCDVEKI